MRRSWCFVAAGVAAGLLAGWEIRGAETATAKDLLAADEAFARASGETGLEAWLAVMAPKVRVFSGDAIVEGFEKVKALYERTGFDPGRCDGRPWEPRFRPPVTWATPTEPGSATARPPRARR